MQDTNNKNAPLELGRLIHILSHKMKCQNDCYTILENSDLTPVQQQLLKFISLRKTISVSLFNFFERRLAKKDVFPFLWGEPFIINVFIFTPQHNYSIFLGDIQINIVKLQKIGYNEKLKAK